MRRWSSGGSHIVGVDVGSGSVALSHIVSSARGVSVRAVSRVALTQEEREKKQVIAGLKRCAQEASAIIQKSLGKERVATCEVMYHPPWTTTRTFVEHAPLKASMPIVADLVEQLEKRALEAHRTESSAPLFERAVMRYEVNGYPTHKPIGKNGAAMSVGIIESALEPELRAAITDVVRQAFPTAAVRDHSAMYVYAAIMQRAFPDWETYSIVDMSSEATACMAIRGGLAQEYATIDFGWRTFLRQLAEQLHSDTEDVLARLRLIARDACVDASCAQVTSAVNQLIPVLTKTFGDLFAQAAQKRRLPSRLIHVAPAPLVQWNELFERIDFAQFTEVGQPFDAHELHAETLAHEADFASGTPQDAGAAIMATFVHNGDVFKPLAV